jgi:hypothetical protein
MMKRISWVAAFAAVLFLGNVPALAQAIAPTTPAIVDVDNAPLAAAEGVVVEAPNADTVVTDTVVTVPYGSWISDAADLLWTVILGAIAWALRQLPGQAADFLKMLRVEQLLARSKEFGVNRTQGAVAGKALSLNVGNEVLAKALQYAIDNGPKWMIEWMGGAAGVRQKLLARIPTDEGTTLS